MASRRKTRPKSSSTTGKAREDGRKTRANRDSTLVHDVRTMVLEDLIQGRLTPGSVLRVPEIAERCGVSRTPVREALTVLAHEGIVRPIPYKGYLVPEVSAADVKDVFFMRRLIEPPAAEIAARAMSDQELEALHAEIAAGPPTSEAMTLEFDRRAHEFHSTIIGATRSPRLVTTFEGVYNDVRRLRGAALGAPRPDLVHEEHAAITEALARRDAEQSRRLMEEHIEAIRLRALEVFTGPMP